MDTKLAAEQPPERDPLVEQTAAPPAEQPPAPPVELRELARGWCRTEAGQSALQAYAAVERRTLEGGGSEDDAALAIQSLVPVTVLLAPRHAEYLATRAGLFGETPEQHLERILREFRSYHDDKRPELTAMEAQRNGGAVTRRVA